MAELSRKACLKGLELGHRGHISGLMGITLGILGLVRPSTAHIIKIGLVRKCLELPGVPSDSDLAED